jgi:FixJ family two-component response regulator
MSAHPSASTVAVVDDDPGVLQSIAYLLESADYVACLFASGAELLASGCLWQIDCLISDIDMPGMDGIQLLERVRAVRSVLPVIFVTALPDARDRVISIAGSPACLTKPFRGAELLAAIGEALARRD